VKTVRLWRKEEGEGVEADRREVDGDTGSSAAQAPREKRINPLKCVPLKDEVRVGVARTPKLPEG